jgi:hypothetical protein
MLRSVAALLALAVCLLGCATKAAERVPLNIDDTQSAGACWLLHVVVDVVADPTTGAPTVKGTGEPLKWPTGYTARRAGTEVEVRDAMGSVVMTTGGRYWMCPTPASDYARPISEWVLGEVKPCPDCELGGGVD